MRREDRLKLKEKVKVCPNAVKGCFGDDVGAFDCLSKIDYGYMKRNYVSIAKAAAGIARKGIALVNTVYQEYVPDSEDMAMEPLQSGQARITELMCESPKDLNYTPQSMEVGVRIASCAYACGATAAGACPITNFKAFL